MSDQKQEIDRLRQALALLWNTSTSIYHNGKLGCFAREDDWRKAMCVLHEVGAWRGEWSAKSADAPPEDK